MCLLTDIWSVVRYGFRGSLPTACSPDGGKGATADPALRAGFETVARPSSRIKPNTPLRITPTRRRKWIPKILSTKAEPGSGCGLFKPKTRVWVTPCLAIQTKPGVVFSTPVGFRRFYSVRWSLGPRWHRLSWRATKLCAPARSSCYIGTFMGFEN